MIQSRYAAIVESDVPAALYRRHRFPAEVSAHCVWRYHRFTVSLRDVEELMAARGVAVTYETIGQWCRTFGPAFAAAQRRSAAGGPGRATSGTSTRCSLPSGGEAPAQSGPGAP